MRKGFTFIELMVILAIIAVTLGVIVMSLSGLSSHKAEAEARKLKAAFFLARESAVNKNSNFIVHLQKDPGKSRTECTVYEEGGSASNPIRKDMFISTINPDPAAPGYDIRFDTFSNTNRTAGIITFSQNTITLTQGAKQRVITLNRKTGYIEVQ